MMKLICDIVMLEGKEKGNANTMEDIIVINQPFVRIVTNHPVQI